MREKQQAIFIADLGFGDAGKGTITDYLTRRCHAHTIVRYNGGPQAAHTVVDTTGKVHTFSQFASGMFLPATITLLSRFMLLNPLNMLKEARHLETCGVPNALQRVLIDRRAKVITPFQRSLNRLREIARAANRHGSCGEGVGECMADALTYGNAILCAGDITDRPTLIHKLRFLQDIKNQEFAELQPLLPRTDEVQLESAFLTDPACLEDCADVYQYFAQKVELVDEAGIHTRFALPGTILFEGAQGVLLDENYGFTPYTTWSTTTFANADTLVQENSYMGNISRLGVTRTYATRHGAGPLPTEDPALAEVLPEPHNSWNDWQQTFRRGYYDFVMARYARELLGKLDYLAVTHADQLASIPAGRVCAAYRYRGPETDLAACFEHQENKITAIKAQSAPDLCHQEQLTGLLQFCMPEYQQSVIPPRAPYLLAERQNAYLTLLAEQLSTPIAIISSGPTARDKLCCIDGLAE